LIRARGILAAYAMARPRRCDTVSALIAGAMGAMAADLSKRSRARILARRVVAELVAEIGRTDQLDIALGNVRKLLADDPALHLALHPGLDLVSEFMRERCNRFSARGCRQIPDSEWRAETESIAAEIEGRLADRFRR
jgi:hypothetical protein